MAAIVMSESQSTTLTRGDIPALVQEVVQSLTRRSNPSQLARTLHHRAWNPTPQGRPHRRPRGVEVKLLRCWYRRRSPLAEIISSLEQQVLQALPRASSSTLTHANAAVDPPLPPQSTNSSTEQHPHHLQVS